MNKRPVVPGDNGREPDFFLPDFCQARTVLAIVLIAALLGVVLALARQNVPGEFWLDLGQTSVFLLWTGLLCAAMWCRLRPRLAHMPLPAASGWALGTMVGTVALVSEAVYWLGLFWAERLGMASGFFPGSHARFLLPKVLIATIVGALALRYFYVSHQWRRSVELEARARIHALQARIRPHFLFNSMNTIAALTRSDPAQAEAAVEDLADLFRISLNDARTQITLAEEMEIARTYQRIESLRLGDRLQVQWDVDSLPERAVVPSLLLQPLLENAIGHGIETLPQGGTVVVRGWLEEDMVVLEVSNPTLPAVARRLSERGNRMALGNIRQRLELAFPGRSGLDVDDQDVRYTVRLRFPRGADAEAAGWTAAADIDLTS
jgi:two-component system, LytTR family, sensor histidine kinase AlgZ